MVAGQGHVFETDPSGRTPLISPIHFLICVPPYSIDSLSYFSLLLNRNETKKRGNHRNNLIGWNPVNHQFYSQIVLHVPGFDRSAVTLSYNFAARFTCISTTSAQDLTVPDIGVSYSQSPSPGLSPSKFWPQNQHRLQNHPRFRWLNNHKSRTFLVYPSLTSQRPI